MTTARFDLLVNKLRELFQLDQPELDFGIYRILHARSGEITAFLEKDLLPQIQQTLTRYQPADKAALQRELDEARAQAAALGADPDTLPKVQELRRRLETEAVDVGALEADVYDHLYRFFSRYYHEGDFISLRRYKEGVYAIPYEGEEVKLHWANQDQYYIKTAEYLRDYAFRLRPNDAANPMRVHFRLVDAAEGEHGNVKEAEGKKRVFVLASGGAITEEPGENGEPELVIRFEYRPATVADWPENVRGGKDKPPAQKDLLESAVNHVLANDAPTLAPWTTALAEKHRKSSGELADYSRLRAHLDRYAARNTFDYFIHKDLGGFLRRELDFYIKSEVMRLDDIDEETAPRVEQYLSKIKVIRGIALKIIEFLAQLEDFQKKLWLKKKFVTETSWCVSIATVLDIEDEALRDELLAAIAANQSQRAEWVALHAIDELAGDLEHPVCDDPLTPEFVAAYPTLMVDTRNFDEAFVTRLLDALGDLDELTDGVLLHSENFQALSLMQARYREQVKCIYIDPPYNTGNDGFAYRDRYQHSSWLAMMADRLVTSARLMTSSALTMISLDDAEAHKLIESDRCLPVNWYHMFTFIWQKVDSPNDNKVAVTPDHEYILAFGNDATLTELSPMPDASILDAYRRDPESGLLYRDRLLKKNGANSRRVDRPTMWYPVTAPDGSNAYPVHDNGEEACWALARVKVDQLAAEGRLIWKRRTIGGDERWEPYTREYAPDVPTRPYPSIWDDVNTMRQAKAQQRALFGSLPLFDTPKPVELVERIARMSGPRSTVLMDFFAGSGTTGHAAINLNREDGLCRKSILVEMGSYFDTVLLPRLKKVTFSPEWKDGKPKRLATPEEAERSPRVFKVVRLESYEDTLNNLELKRTDAQQSLLDLPQAHGAGGMKEQYVLSYMLDVESRGGASLLNVSRFADPRAYALKVKRPGSDESREVVVDLLETFNWLLGLRVRHLASPRTYSASFARDDEGRLRLDDRVTPASDGPWWFRTVEGESPDGRKVLVIWRTRPGGDDASGIEEDNLVLDEWFMKQGYSAKDSEFDLIYVNGDNNLENLKGPDDRWKVRLIEEEFFRLMFDVEDVR